MTITKKTDIFWLSIFSEWAVYNENEIMPPWIKRI